MGDIRRFWIYICLENEQRMPMHDQHLHSHHSMDCRTEPAANVEAALAAGLSGLTFTEHFDTHPEDWKECVYDDKAYSAAIHELRERYGKRLFVGKGIEVCFQPGRMEFILEFLERHDFDLVILSVHCFGDLAIHKKENWSAMTLHQGTERYLQFVLEAVGFCEQLHARSGRVFDVLGHLDLVKRYTQRYFGDHDVAGHGPLIDSILQTCLRADIIPEINTSTLRQGLDEPMPGPSTVKRYAELGGTMMSLGSDAHRAEDIGAGFAEASAMLRDAGITSAPVFKGRERMLEGV